VKFLSLARRKGVDVAGLASAMRRFPQVLENVRVEHKERLEDAAEVWNAVREAQDMLGATGRVLVRASGTEPLVRVMVEAESEGVASGCAEVLAEIVADALA